MIIEYHRPNTLDEALTLLARRDPATVPLGGGSLLNAPAPEPVAVVDLQNLGLNEIRRRGSALETGATVTLQELDAWLAEAAGIPYAGALGRAIRHEATYNLRNVATLAGTLVGADGRSPLTTALLALDARLAVLPEMQPASGDSEEQTETPGKAQGEADLSLGDFLPLRSERPRGRLITQVLLPLNARLGIEWVARTPADRLIVCAAVARWPSGRTRVALGGFGRAPVLALDGPEPGGAEVAARNAYAQAGDEWASAEYRQEVAAVLTRRCIEGLENE
jgi:CO/xanthine dehydrogenase FAD-binding subunit